jgi:FKBP-type peptidyl-prolyl cis-trans isomerase
MKRSLLIFALCCALVAGVSGCGGDDSATSQSSDGSATTTNRSAATGDGDKAKSGEGPLKTPPSEVALGDYEAEGPFSAVSGQKGDKKPRFTPSGQPAPKKIVTRDLEVGSGPPARRGDEVSVYFAGAIYETGKVELYGWPPSAPSTFELGGGLYGKSWEKTIEGMKAGGIRQVILPSSEFAAGKPVDYVIVLKDLQPKSE